MRVAVFDLGKSNAKLALVDTRHAREVDVLSTPTPMIEGPPYRHFDVGALWAFLVDSLVRFNRAGGIDAICVTTHGATVALLAASGELALPVLDYEDVGPESCRSEYDAVRPPFSETGSPRLPNGLNVGAQLYWQQSRFPTTFAAVAHIVTWPQYWVYRLSGELASDATSLGCHTDLLNPHSGAYSSLALGQGWQRALPAIRASGGRIGTITKALARQTGLPEDTSVHVGIHDSNASLVPHLLATTQPCTVVSTGTWVIVMALGSQPPTLDPSRDTLINVDAFGKPVPSARFMGGREYEILNRPGAEVTIGNQDETSLSRVLDAGVMLLPAIVGDSGPYSGREPRWSVPESTLDDAMHEVVIAHYLAMMTLTCMNLIGAQGTIVIEGPFAANRHYIDMLSAAGERPVLTGAARTGTSVGAAMLIQAPEQPAAMQRIDVSDERKQRLREHAERWRRAMPA